MFLKIVCCFIFITFGTATFTNENQQFLASRDPNSRYQCCRGNDHIPYRNFNDRRDYDPHYKKYGHEYHEHRYQDRPYYRPNRLNYYDYKPPLPPPPPPPPPSILPSYINSKGYYSRRYDKPSYLGPKYMQNRVGFIFPDTDNTNVKEGNGGYRPYVPSVTVKFKDSKYYKQDYDNFRDKNEQKFYQQDVIKRRKYKPGLLQSISLGNPGTVIASGPNGYKHVIHNLPPWADITPEKENFEGPNPTRLDHRGGIEYAEPHRFSSGFHRRPHIPGQQGVITGSIYVEDPGSAFNKNQNHGSSKDIITTEDFGEYDKPPKTEEFHPSPPFYRYSEPDPLYHPNGSPLQTYPTTEASESPVTKPSTAAKEQSTSEQSSRYPDSINAQLPPTTEDADTMVPYVAATAVTEQTPVQHNTVVTQATEATDKKPLVKLRPTTSSDQSTTTPTPTKQEHSPSDEIKIFLPSIPILDTPRNTSRADEITIGLYLPKNISNEIKIYLPRTQNQNSSQSRPRSHMASSSDQNVSSVNPTVIPFLNTATKTAIFLPTAITEILSTESSLKEHKVSSEDNFSHQFNRKSLLVVDSPPETLALSPVTPDQGVKDDEFKKPMVIVVPDTKKIFDSDLNKNNSIPEEIDSTSVALRATSVTPETESSITQSTEHSSERIPLTTLMHSTTEQTSITDLIDNLSTESELHEVNQIMKNSSLVNHLQTLVNHARTLDYLQHDDGTTNVPLEESD